MAGEHRAPGGVVDLGLTDRRALVTGASRGIGLAVTRQLVAEGARVVTGSRDTSPELEELVAAGSVVAVRVDLADPAGPGELVAAALADGPVDVLVNNAGAVTPRLEGSLSITDDQWRRTLDLTLLAPVRTTRALLPHLLARGSGSIVSTASVNAVLPDPLVLDYGAAKAALVNFSKGLSKEVGPQGVRVNTVSPGPVSTALWLGPGGVADTVSGGSAAPESIAAQAVAGTATRRFTTPEEVAALIVFLASDRSANTTGTDVLIDGGMVQTV